MSNFKGKTPTSLAMLKQYSLNRTKEISDEANMTCPAKRKNREPVRHLDTVMKSFLYQSISIIDADGKEIIMSSMEHIVAALMKRAIYDQNLKAIEMIFKYIGGGADKIELTHKTEHSEITDEMRQQLADAGVNFISKDVVDASFEMVHDDEEDLFS